MTVDEMLLPHARGAPRGAQRAHVVGDMPFMSFQVSPREALAQRRPLDEGGRRRAVKLEGGEEVAEHVRRIVAAGIPVMGHVGLTPQSVHAMGGFKVQGATRSAAPSAARRRHGAGGGRRLRDRARGDPGRPGRRRSPARLTVPTIGIGAGPDCDGQVLVMHDLLGLADDFQAQVRQALRRLGGGGSAGPSPHTAGRCERGSFPTDAHSYQ